MRIILQWIHLIIAELNFTKYKELKKYGRNIYEKATKVFSTYSY